MPAKYSIVHNGIWLRVYHNMQPCTFAKMKVRWRSVFGYVSGLKRWIPSSQKKKAIADGITCTYMSDLLAPDWIPYYCLEGQLKSRTMETSKPTYERSPGRTLQTTELAGISAGPELAEPDGHTHIQSGQKEN